METTTTLAPDREGRERGPALPFTAERSTSPALAALTIPFFATLRPRRTSTGWARGSRPKTRRENSPRWTLDSFHHRA